MLTAFQNVDFFSLSPLLQEKFLYGHKQYSEHDASDVR